MPRPGPEPADVATLAEICRQNLHALMIGATPAYYVPGAFDGGVQGIVLSLQLPGRADRIDCSQVNILGELPLQSTLFALTKAAAGLLQQSGVRPAAITGAGLGLTVLWDAAMHGSAEVPQLQGVDPHRASSFRGPARIAGRSPGTRRRGRKISCARPSICCGCRPLRGDRCSAWQSFRRSIGSRWPMFPNRVPARIFACRRLRARFIPAMRTRSTARLTNGSRTSRSPNPGQRSWFPMPAGSIRAGWPPMSSAA